MKRIGKKLLTTSLAAALIIGGGAAVLRTTAYADNTTNSTAASGTTTDGTQAPAKGDRGPGHGGMRMGGPRIAEETATLLGIDVQTVMTELQAGKTLAQIAQEKSGWDEQTLLDKLTAALSAKLDDDVKSGKLTQAQADDQKAKLADSLKKAVEQAGMPFGGKGGRGGHDGFGGFGGFGDAAQLKDIATMLNLSETDLKAKLQAGQSLAAIAQAQGVNEDDLIAKIKDGMTDRIKQFVERVHKAPAANGTAPANQQAPAAPAASA